MAPKADRQILGADLNVIVKRKFGGSLVVFQTVRDHPEGQGLDVSDGLFPRGTIRQHTGHVRHLGNPTPINFAVDFDFEIHDRFSVWR